MRIFQDWYNRIKAIQTPAWIKVLGGVVDQMLKDSLSHIKDAVIDALKAKIIELEGTTLSGADKFKALAVYAKEQGINIAKNELNVFLNSLVLSVKKQF